MEKKKAIRQKLSEYLKRNRGASRPLVVTIKRVNEILRGWINYFRIGMMKLFIKDLGAGLLNPLQYYLRKVGI